MKFPVPLSKFISFEGDLVVLEGHGNDFGMFAWYRINLNESSEGKATARRVGRENCCACPSRLPVTLESLPEFRFLIDNG